MIWVAVFSLVALVVLMVALVVEMEEVRGS